MSQKDPYLSRLGGSTVWAIRNDIIGNLDYEEFPWMVFCNTSSFEKIIYGAKFKGRVEQNIGEDPISPLEGINIKYRFYLPIIGNWWSARGVYFSSISPHFFTPFKGPERELGLL